MNLIPSFNECADKVIEKLRPLADGINSISISEEFSSFTLDVISKVWSDWGVPVRSVSIILILHWCQVAFGSDFSEPEWEGVYKLKHSKGEQGLLYLVSHALRGAQMSLALPLLRVFACIFSPILVELVHFSPLFSCFQVTLRNTVRQHVLWELWALSVLKNE